LALLLDAGIHPLGLVDHVNLHVHGGRLRPGRQGAAQRTHLPAGEDRLTLLGDDGHFARNDAAAVETRSAGEDARAYGSGQQRIGSDHATGVRHIRHGAHQVAAASGECDICCITAHSRDHTA